MSTYCILRAQWYRCQGYNGCRDANPSPSGNNSNQNQESSWQLSTTHLLSNNLGNLFFRAQLHRNAGRLISLLPDALALGKRQHRDHMILCVEVLLGFRHIKPLDSITHDGDILNIQRCVDRRTFLLNVVPLAVVIEVHLGCMLGLIRVKRSRGEKIS